MERIIPPASLISDEFAAFTKGLVAADGVLSIYLHRSGAPLQIGGGEYGSQTVNTLPVDAALESYLKLALSNVDALIGLDLRFVDQPEQADVRFILDSQLKLAGDDSILGIALSNSTQAGQWWEVLLNGPALSADRPYLAYAAIHEFGHVFGLEHPFDAGDGDSFSSSSPWESAYPQETVLAYRDPANGLWPQSYTANDVAALAEVWGLESGLSLPADLGAPQTLRGSETDDVIIGGLAGDRLWGMAGSDLLIGGGGGDLLWGGQGANRFWVEADGAVDEVLLTPDARRSPDPQRVDLIEGLGPEDRIAVLGVRSKDLLVRPTSLLTPSFGQLDGIGIWARGRLEGLVLSEGVGLDQVRDLTIARSVSYQASL